MQEVGILNEHYRIVKAYTFFDVKKKIRRDGTQVYILLAVIISRSEKQFSFQTLLNPVL